MPAQDLYLLTRRKHHSLVTPHRLLRVPPTFLITGDCPSPLSVLIAIIYVALWANVAADALLTATAAVVVTATTAVTRVTLAAAADLRVHLSSTLGTSASGSLAVLR